MITNANSLGPSLETDQLRQIAEAIRNPGSLADLATQWDFESGNLLLERVARTLGLEWLGTDEIEFDRSALEGFPLKLIHRYDIFPLERTESWIRLAVSDPFAFEAFDSIASAVSLEVRPVVASPEQVRQLIKRHLGVGAETVDGLIALQRQQYGDVEMLEELDLDGSEDAEAASQASVVRLVNEILTEAIELRASDIHIEAQEGTLKIRYRIDGILQKQSTPAEMNQFQAAIVSRLKIMAKLNIAEKRIPQDGRIKLRVAGREVDIRLSIIPMLHGESAVMRVLDKSNLSFSLKGIGMSERTYEQFQKLIRLPHGIVLVTGPTGSGKSTTLAAMIDYINKEQAKHIITIEDPIEFIHKSRRSLIKQREVGIHTHEFDNALKACLREDPDIILVGEMRDKATVNTALKAAQTGHLVLGTLHTSSAVKTLDRILTLYSAEERESLLVAIAESLVCIISQGLCRTTDSKRTAFHDILVNTETVKDYIRSGKNDEILELMKDGEYHGMITTNQSLFNLYQEGRINDEVALEMSPVPNELAMMLRGRI